VKKKKITKNEAPQTLGVKIGKTLGNYFTTQFILMLFVGFSTWGILALLNVKYAILLGIATGVLSAVPNFGMFIAVVAITLVAIFDKAVFLPNSPSIIEGVVVFLIFVIFNKLVDFLIAPIFLGKTNKANPLVLLLVTLFGTIFFGITGALLAMPLYLVVKTTIDHFRGQ
jgi:predicted PurR-regulated permease PerM